MNKLLLVAFAASAAVFGIVNAECLDGWRSLNGDCFYVSTDFDEEELSWPEARDFCRSQGASLAEPTTVKQVKEVAGLLNEDGTRWGTFWVGARNGNTDTYTWLNGGEAVSAGWRKRQPSTKDPWRCVAIIWAASDTGLEVWRCKNHGRFICQAPESKTITTPAPVECPSDWISNELGCFRIFADHKNWWQAQKFCQQHGSHLAVPQTKTKKSVRVLTSMLNQDGLKFGDFWVGGQKISDEYKWNDGEEVDSNSWRAGQPNEDLLKFKQPICLAIRYMEWYGHNDSGAETSLCKDYRRFICQKV